MKLRMELSGGLELLFGNVKVHNVDFPVQEGKQQVVMSEFLVWTRDNLLKERPELFMKGVSVRPGILVLINECDWELSGELSAQLSEGDTVVFISTLHGG